MQISSLLFILFTFASILIYYLTCLKYRIAFLTIVSCIYIFSLNSLLLYYLLFYAFTNFKIAKLIYKNRTKHFIFVFGIIINIIQLLLLKYSSEFFPQLFESISTDFLTFGFNKVLIPIGVSYFTLQGIGYLINVKTGRELPEANFVTLLLYFIFFPKFISGPIERSNHFIPQLYTSLKFDEVRIWNGLRTALLGFFKKVAIADQLGVFIHSGYAEIDTQSRATLVSLILLQPLYLYFDFSGYTDIVLGISKTFGIDLLPNFNRPFMARNVTTFWKSFHMSLSLWLNDYVFKQISFKVRKIGQSASIVAVFVTFFLFGIWHGAGWNFMILGFLQSIFVIYEYFTKKYRKMLFSHFSKTTETWIGRILTYIFYAFSLILFFSPNMSESFHLLSNLFNNPSYVESNIPNEAFLLSTFLAICLIILEVITTDYTIIWNQFLIQMSTYQGKKWFIACKWISYFIVVTLVIVYHNKYQTFVYFGF